MNNTGSGLVYTITKEQMVDLARAVATVVHETVGPAKQRIRMYRALIWAFEQNDLRDVTPEIRGLDAEYDQAFRDSHPMWGRL